MWVGVQKLNWMILESHVRIWPVLLEQTTDIVCILSLLKIHISYIFLKKIQVFFKLLEKNLTWNFKFKSSQVLLQQVQVRSSSGSAWPGTSSQVKFEHFQVFWTLYLQHNVFQTIFSDGSLLSLSYHYTTFEMPRGGINPNWCYHYTIIGNLV